MDKHPDENLEKTVKKFMRDNFEDYVDPLTNELNITHIAETAINEYALDDSETAPVWDWAVEVEEALADADLVNRI